MPMKRRYILGAIVILACGALVVFAARYAQRVGQSLTSGPGSGEKPTIRLVKNPVRVADVTFQDLDGRTISTRDWKGKVTIINFWATWCPPCRAEIPDLIKLQDKYRDQLQIIGISTDEGSIEEVRQFARQYKINYPVVMQTSELQKGFPGVFALPTSFVIDKDGNAVQKHVGLISPAIYELETRVLAGMPTDVTVERVEDDGRVLLANAALATEIPGVDLSKLPAGRKSATLRRLNEESCTCGCNLTVAQCRINDSSCNISPTIARRIVDEELAK